MTVFLPVCVISTCLCGRGFGTHADITRFPLKGFVCGGVAHERTKKRCCFRRDAVFPARGSLLLYRFSILSAAANETDCRKGSVSGNGAGHTGNLERCCRENALSEAKICLFCRKPQLFFCGKRSGSAENGFRQRRFCAEAQCLCHLQHRCGREFLTQGNKIGIAGIAHGFQHGLLSVAVCIMTAENLCANCYRTSAVPAEGIGVPLFFGACRGHQLKDGTHRIGIAGTVDQRAVRIL